MENKVSIVISEPNYATILNHLEAVAELIKQSTITLSAEERQTLPKMGNKTFGFVTKAYDYSVINPKFIPPFVMVSEWKIDMDAHRQLTNLLRVAEQICTSLDDSAMLCGSEAYTAALGFYNTVKQGVKMDTADAKPIYEDLSAWFPAKNSKKVEA